MKSDTKITRGLLIREPWIGMILDGRKDWEMRTSATKIRGPVALIAAGSGKIIGVAEITGVEGPLSPAQMQFNRKRHRIPDEELSKKEIARWNTAWVMKDAKRLATPVDYKHPSGAVIWVALDDDTQARLARELAKPRAKRPQPKR